MNTARIATILCAALASGCGLTGPSGPNAEAQARLTAAKRLWQSQALSDYSYVLSRGCFCVLEYREPASITVRGGKVASAVSVASGEPRDPAWYETVEGLFESIQHAIDDDAVVIEAQYDPVRGYPISVYIDVDHRIADEEISYQARALTPIR
ncbi:MAG: hypothetical protein K1Y01_10230 [Vicinamibacteria bacterium]|nr:hypothetical protein [Vicinamibacteria bacterium]